MRLDFREKTCVYISKQYANKVIYRFVAAIAERFRGADAQNLYGGKASARPRSLPYGDEGNFARIRPKDTASAGKACATQRKKNRESVFLSRQGSVSGAQ